MMGYYGGMGFGGLGMVLFWVLVVVGVVYLVKLFSQGQALGHNEGRAKEILRERYARGEINQEQFDRLKRELTA